LAYTRQVGRDEASASIVNRVSFNDMSYDHDYLAVEFGMFPHQVSEGVPWVGVPRPDANRR
jgi:hypothetical protein